MAVSIAFPHRLAGHCASGAFRDLFEFRGYGDAGEPLSEAMIFGLGAGLGAMHVRGPAGGYAAGRSPQLEESLFERVGGAVCRHAEWDLDVAWEALRARLDAGEPVALLADCQKLEYLRTRASMPLHVVVATGYDEHHALIADNDRAEIQRCGLDSLRSARAATGFPLPAMNVTFDVRWPESLPPLASILRPAIAEVVEQFARPRGAAVLLYGRRAFGFGALDAIEQQALDWIAQPPGPRDRARIALAYWLAVEKGGTGGGFFRRLYRDFLGEVHARLGGPALAGARRHYASLTEGWSELGAAAATGHFDPARLARLIRAEREGVSLLARAVAEG